KKPSHLLTFLALRFGDSALPRLLPFRTCGAECFQSAGHNTEHEQRDERRARREAKLVSPDGLLKFIKLAGWTGDHRLAAQMSFNVPSKAVSRFVTAREVFLQCFHHDPIQIA